MLKNRKISDACLHDNSNLVELTRLTEELPTFESFTKPFNHTLQVEMEKGTGFGWGWADPQFSGRISIAKWFASSNSVFPKHAHKEREWLIVYLGEMHLHIKEDVHVLKEGDFKFMLPDTPHSAEFPIDTWYLAITIPANKDWPNGRIAGRLE